MQRTIIHKIEKWYAKEDFKPLLLNGARQVGKTWLMLEFANTYCHDNYIYVNFEDEPSLSDIFSYDFDIDRIERTISIALNKKIDDTTLFLFDEIQSVERGITALKYFNEKAPKRHIIAAGSLLGISLHPGDSFPVGKTEMLDIYPLSFNEFLLATGNEALSEEIADKQWTLLQPFESKLERLLKEYYFVGGMPEVVEAFIKGASVDDVRALQLDLLRNYELDFSKHAPANEVPRIRMIWQSIPFQLAKENRKFIYGQVRKGSRARDFESAIRWLRDAGLIYLIHRVTKGELPLKAYEEMDVFKVFMLDVGLLAAMSGLSRKTLVEGSEIFSIFKGALTEQYVCQQLISGTHPSLYYWSSNDSQAEIDFVTELCGKVMPIEVKASTNLQSKSLRAFCERFNLDDSLRLSLSGYKEQEHLTNCPLWAIDSLNQGATTPKAE